MPALMPTEFTARVTWLGANPDRAAGLPSRPLDRMALGFAGHAGETHAGLTRPSCSRVVAQHPKGTVIRNVRQLTILSAEDLAAIAAEMGLDTLDPGLAGASVVIEGIPDFTHVPPSSRLQGPDGVTLVVDMENRPVTCPPSRSTRRGRATARRSRRRKGAARRHRLGRTRRRAVGGRHAAPAHPDQPVWPHLDRARGA